jgi:ATP-dependent helicase HrpA
MDALITFMRAQLDADERAAQALAGATRFIDRRPDFYGVGGPAANLGEAFADLLAIARKEVDPGVRVTMGDVLKTLTAWREADRALTGRADLHTLPALTEMKSQVARLMEGPDPVAGGGFISQAGARQLREYPRYLAAVVLRRERLSSQVARDRQLMDQVAGVQEAWLHAVAAVPPGQPWPAKLRTVRWMLEEYRVSLWAQELGTRGSVSDQRIRKALA